MSRLSRPEWFSIAYFVTFLLAVLMCALNFGGAEAMLLCVSGFAQILHHADRAADTAR